jgi:hypothetical protein
MLSSFFLHLYKDIFFKADFFLTLKGEACLVVNWPLGSHSKYGIDLGVGSSLSLYKGFSAEPYILIRNPNRFRTTRR